MRLRACQTAQPVFLGRVRTTNRQSARKNRGGYLYVAVLVVATIVGLIGLSAVSVARLQVKATADASDATNAARLAQSAIEHALSVIDNDSSWRTNYVSSVSYPATPVQLNGGTFTWQLIDPDGSLNDDDSDVVTVLGIGQVGDIKSAQSVVLYPTGNGIDSLGQAFHCNADVTLGFIVDFDSDQTISSNGSISASAFGASIDGDARAVGSISGNVTGDELESQAALRMPGSDVFEFYKHRGTWIDYDSLPGSIGDRELDGDLLSPNNNDYGPTNAAGIYVIDCQFQRITIRDSRIVGTLVLLNPSSSSRIQGRVRWDSAVANLPTLLVDGDIEFRFRNQSLSESTEGTNFNPPGTPYNGDEDTTSDDTYPSSIDGLVYVSGKLRIPGDFLKTECKGVVLCSQVQAGSDSTFDFDSTFSNSPPPGFAFGNSMKIVPGSWKLDVAP